MIVFTYLLRMIYVVAIGLVDSVGGGGGGGGYDTYIHILVSRIVLFISGLLLIGVC